MRSTRPGRQLSWLIYLFATSAHADLVVAVAANFKPTLSAIIADFPHSASEPIRLVSASSGSLYAQIRQGAPYDVFFSADQARVDALLEMGLAIARTRKTYAEGQLVLITRTTRSETSLETLLNQADLTIAIANPRTAPYGSAARSLLAGYTHGRVAEMPNVAAAYSAFLSGAADVALVAASLLANIDRTQVRVIDIPTTSYPALKHDAIVLLRASNQETAMQLLEYVSAPAQRERLRAAGYRLVAQ